MVKKKSPIKGTLTPKDVTKLVKSAEVFEAENKDVDIVVTSGGFKDAPVPGSVAEDSEEKPLELSKDFTKKVFNRCPACPWKPGLIDESTLCPQCNGSGQIEADPVI